MHDFIWKQLESIVAQIPAGSTERAIACPCICADWKVGGWEKRTEMFRSAVPGPIRLGQLLFHEVFGVFAAEFFQFSKNAISIFFIKLRALETVSV